MKHKYKISPALAWQSYDCIDMLFVLNSMSIFFATASGPINYRKYVV